MSIKIMLQSRLNRMNREKGEKIKESMPRFSTIDRYVISVMRGNQ